MRRLLATAAAGLVMASLMAPVEVAAQSTTSEVPPSTVVDDTTTTVVGDEPDDATTTSVAEQPTTTTGEEADETTTTSVVEQPTSTTGEVPDDTTPSTTTSVADQPTTTEEPPAEEPPVEELPVEAEPPAEDEPLVTAALIAGCTPDAGYDTCVAYTYEGSDQSFVVPAGVSEVFVKAWGAGGGGGVRNPGVWGAPGGAGGYVAGTLPVLPGDEFVVMVGRGGAPDGAGVGPAADALCARGYGFGGACAGPNPNFGNSWGDGGGGGGLSGLFTGSAPVVETDQARALLVAGGGGASETTNYCRHDPSNIHGHASGGAGGNGFAGTGAGASGMRGADGVSDFSTVVALTGGGGGYQGGGKANGRNRWVTNFPTAAPCVDSSNGGTNFLAPTATATADLAGAEHSSTTGYPDLGLNLPPNTTDPHYSLVPFVGQGLYFAHENVTSGNGFVVIQFDEPDSDFGDAPDTYGTLLADDGARHGIPGYDDQTNTAPLMLGATIDPENDGLPGTDADGDDLDNVADEDGVVFNTNVSVPGRLETVWVTASADGFLNGWIDFDLDGVFDPSEQIATDVPVVAGVNQILYTVPTGADFVAGDSYGRFRITSQEGQATTPTGAAPDGEVEDYLRTLFDAPTVALNECPAGSIPVPVSIIQNPSFEDRTGDFTQTGASTIGFAEHWGDSHPSGGQYHVFSPTFDSGPPESVMPVRAGAEGYGSMSGHSSGIVGALSAGDFGEGATNTLAAPLIPGATYVGFFSMVAAGYNREGDGYMRFFGTSDPDVGHIQHAAVTPPTAANIEALFDTTVVNYPGAGVRPTWELSTFSLVPSQPWDYLRVEARNANSAADANTTVAGQVWMNFDDFHMYLCDPQRDFGDAPDSYGSLLASGGPYHDIPGYDSATNTAPLMLGSSIDTEDDGQPTTAADGDGGDEDGVEFNPALGVGGGINLIQDGTTNDVQVSVTGNGFLNAWVDFNQDGDFDDADEQIANDLAVSAGSNSVSFTPPAQTAQGPTYARFRLTSEAGQATTPAGPAPDGEVEDYLVHVATPVTTECGAGLINPGFEEPDIHGPTPFLAQFGPDIKVYADEYVPGWNDVGGVVELWRDGTAFDAGLPPVPSYEGEQFAEFAAGYYQDVATIPGTTLTWSFAHRGRIGADTVRLMLGAVPAPGGTYSPDFTTDATTGNTGWQVYSGSYTIPAGQFVTRLQFVSIATASGDIGAGNFLDAVTLGVVCTDYGDAPDTYGTLLADDGPGHAVPGYDSATNTAPLMLGSSIDIDTDGQPSVAADADDFDDGVANPITLVIGQTTTVDVTVTNNTGEPATLAGWIDINDDGDFDDPGELQFVTVAGSSGTTTPQLTFPAAALPSDGTYARFRLFPGELDETGLSPTGPASAGEVEDYPVVGPVAIDLQCPSVYALQGGSPYNVYEVDTPTGDMTVVGQFESGSGTANGLGISADARYLFSHRNGEVLRFDSHTGVSDTFPGVAGFTATHGGVDPSSGIYYYGNLASRNIYAFDPATGTDLGQVAELAFDVDPAGNNGDWSFDSQGNLYVVGGSATDSSLYVVGGLPTTAQTTPVDVTGDQITTFETDGAAVNGIAFDATGSLFAASNAIIFEIDPATGDVLDQQDLDPSGVSVDLASCSTPPSIVVQKDIVERFEPGDQFEVTVTGGGISGNNVGVTEGTDTGVQDESGEFAGPVLGRPGSSYDISETGLSGADLADYTTTWQCVDENAGGALVAEGDGSDGSFTIPDTVDGLGAAIVCIFVNEPAPVEAWTVVKTSDVAGSVGPGDVVTYTLAVQNTGNVDLPAEDVLVEDDLAEVLDDASYNNDADQGAVFNDPVISWSDDLAVGEVVTITYSVTVNDADSIGDGRLVNAVTGGDCPDPAVTDPQDPDFNPECVIDDPVRALDIDKSSDPADGSTVAPGDTVTYTVTVENIGGFDYTPADPAEMSDDLSGVIDDALYNDDADAGGVGNVTYAQPTLTWTGPLAVAETVTITYTVTVLDGENLGDAVLENVVTGVDSDCPDPAITDPDDPDYNPDCHNPLPVGAVHYLKTVDPPDPLALQPGDTYTYTVTATNIGATDLTALTFTDDLTDVLDDGTFEVGSETADIGTAAFNGTDAVDWSGDLAVGEVATVTYQVTIDSPPGGNSVLINAVVGTGPGSNCPPPGPPTDPDCFKQIPQPQIDTAKTSDAPGDVEPGEVVVYEFTVSNDGDGPAQAFEVSDDLSGVLDDATYNGDVTMVSGPGGVVFDPVNQEIVWTGPLDAGESATVTYSVTINAADELGDGVLVNALTAPDCPDPAITDPADPDFDTECVIITPVQAWTAVKTSDAAGDVEPGDDVTYTITVENTGGVDLSAIGLTDDLSDVLDDATFDPSSVDVPFGDVSFDPVAAEFMWGVTPPQVLSAGQTVVISYTVTVNDADELGNGRLINAITGPPNCPDPAITDPADPNFDPDCVIDTPVRAWTGVKTSDAAGNVEPGDIVTYTITVTNTGDVALPAAEVVNVDDLAEVLDDAAYNDDADDGGHTGTFDFTAPLLSWTGDLAVGEVVSLTYSATVNDADELGDGRLLDAITGSPNCPDPAITDPDDADFDPDCVVIDDIESWTAVKTSDAVGNVEPGDTVGYEVTVTNTGNVALTAADVVNVDDLSQVLDDASYDGDADDGGHAGTFDFTAPLLTWSGDLAVDEVVTLTYSVTVNDADELGDGQLVNAITGSSNCPDPAITDPDDPGFDPDCVVDPDVEAWTAVKTSDAVGNVEPGDVVTYTLTVTNTGNVDLQAENVIVSDDLTDVLDDASFNDVSATAGAPAFLAPILSWTGDLAVDDVVTVTYSVTVNDATELGDGRLANAVTGSSNCPDPAIVDPDDPGFDPDCVVVDDIEAWTSVKTSDAGDPVLPGDTITYTVTVTNTGNVALDDPAELPAIADDLTAVLDDATYNDDADSGGEGTLAYAPPVLSWTGELAVDQVVTITYTVTVGDADQLGDGVLVNAITGSPNCPDPAITDPADPAFDPECVIVEEVDAYTVAKTSDAADPTLPGDVVTYTVTVTNTGGTGLSGAFFDDDLSGVLDDAALEDTSLTADVGTVTFAAPTLSWIGDLAVDQVATVTYSVTVDSPIEGDHRLANAIVGGDCPDPAITDPDDPAFDPDCVVIDPLRGVRIDKVIFGEEVTDLEAGDSFDYVVTVENIGQVDLVAETFTDDLTEVLDDATLDEASLTADVGTATFTDPTLTWVGDLAVGEVATVSYSITIDDPLAGDGELLNAVVGPIYSNCVPPDPDDPACRQVTPVPNVVVGKELVSPEFPQPGDVVTYRIVAENRGGAVATDEEIGDDLTGVLDDAVYNDDAAASLAGDLSYSEPVITWTGDIAAGDRLELDYSVTVNDLAALGDGVLDNAVTGGENCPADDEACHRRTPLPAYEGTKTVVSPADPEPGDVITYRVTITNTGGVPVDDAEVSDDLSGVLDDAVYNDDAVATAGSGSFTSPTLTWTGPLAVDEVVTVTYTVTVNSVEDLGDARLVNTLTAPNCDPASGEAAGVDAAQMPPGCETDTRLPAVHYEKVLVTPADGEGGPDEVVGYRIQVTNVGAADLTGLSFTDDLSAVLANAIYLDDAATDTGTVSYASPTLTWTGDLPVDGTAIVTYSARLDSDAPPGTAMQNIVVGAGAGSNCPSGSTDPACAAVVSVAQGGGGGIVQTGAEFLWLAALAAALLAAGAAALAITGRLRRRATPRPTP